MIYDTLDKDNIQIETISAKYESQAKQLPGMGLRSSDDKFAIDI